MAPENRNAHLQSHSTVDIARKPWTAPSVITSAFRETASGTHTVQAESLVTALEKAYWS